MDPYRPGAVESESTYSGSVRTADTLAESTEASDDYRSAPDEQTQ